MASYNSITGAVIPDSPTIQKNVSFSRPANTTTYTIGDAVAPATTAITAATNASPAVITSVAHGLATGDRVTIAASGGNTAINGDWVVTVLTVDTFKISTEAGYLAGSFVAGNGAWTSGGTVQRMLRLADVVPYNGGSGSIVAIRLTVSSATVTLGTFRIRFFNSPVSQIADNAAWTLLDANKTKRSGYVDLSIVATDGSGSDSAEVMNVLSQPLPFVCDASRADLFLQVSALGAYVPESGDAFRIEVTIRRDQVAPATRLSM